VHARHVDDCLAAGGILTCFLRPAIASRRFSYL
jgi:hypothetical protein